MLWIIEKVDKTLSENFLGTVNDFKVGYTDCIGTACHVNKKLKYVFMKINVDEKCTGKQTSGVEKNAFTVLMASSAGTCGTTKRPEKILSDGARFTSKTYCIRNILSIVLVV